MSKLLLKDSKVKWIPIKLGGMNLFFDKKHTILFKDENYGLLAHPWIMEVGGAN